MGCIEVFVVFSVRPFNLTVVFGSIRLDQLVPDPFLFEVYLKERHIFWLFAAPKLLGKLKAVICLYALDRIRKLLYAMPDELSGGIGTVLLERLQVAKTAVFVDEGVLVVIAAILCCVAERIADQTRLRDVFHVDLYPLAGILHLLIGLRNVLRVWQLHCHLPSVP